MILLSLYALVVSTSALGPPEPFDFIEDAILKYVNHSVDPCDNFYRHACSFSSPNPVIQNSLQRVYDYLNNTQKDSYWNKLQIATESQDLIPEMNDLSDIDVVVVLYSQVLKRVCEERKELLPEITERIFLMSVLPFQEEEELKELRRVKRSNTILEEDFCELTIEKIEVLIRENLEKSRIDTSGYLGEFLQYVTELIETAKGISFHLDIDVREGIEETRKMVEATLRIARNLIKDTPWARNKHVVAKIKNITSSLALYDNYGRDFKLVTDSLFGIEKNYTECKRKLTFFEDSALFCYISTARTFEFPPILIEAFSFESNAMNAHPSIAFGFPMYYHSKYGREMSTKLGFTGTTIGHEIGHTFFDNHAHLEILPYFSKKVEDCVQNQFHKTCLEFEEKSCVVSEEFLDENGADIFGVQLAYELLKNYYGSKAVEEIERLQMTYEQSFFYAYAVQHCNGYPSNIVQYYDGSYEEHSANNVRVNAIAQHPGFRAAFNCPLDSRMIKSATAQCHIYGSDAPETRRRKFNY